MIIDISLDVDIVITTDANQGQIVSNVIEKVKDFFHIDSNELGETISLSMLYGKISEQPGVLNVIDVRVYNEVGGTYSNSQISQSFMATSPTNPNNNRIGVIDQTILIYE